LVVGGDRGGEAAEACGDGFFEAGEGACAVAFEVRRSLQVEKIDSIGWRMGV
jgi:hypothetical protein